MKCFINLPISDLPRTMAFYRTLGFSFNPQFTDETAAGMTIGDDCFAMLLTHAKFDSFISRPRGDATRTTPALYALMLGSREEVDRMVERAVKHGGSDYRAAQDLGFMYSRAFADPDGHVWEPFWMDASAISPPSEGT